MLTERFVALAFTAAALAGAMSWPVWIAVALGAHGLWDWAHHRERVPTHMPRWYVPFCAVFDWVYATGLLGIWWKEGVLTAWVMPVSGELRPSSGTLMASTAVIFSRLGVGS